MAEVLNLAVSGALGRMGGRILYTITQDPACKLAQAIDSAAHPNFGRDAGESHNFGTLGVKVRETLASRANALIDFSLPAGVQKRLDECLATGTPIVVGTTGIPEALLGVLREAATRIPVLVSPNMSVGVNLLWKIAAEVAKALGDDYDIEIVEAHHRMKVDSPSGTAAKLAEAVAQALGRDLKTVACYGRQGNVGKRPPKEIGIHAVRMGSVVGDHTISFASTEERIELTHKAQSRDVFAAGAVRAAKWLARQKPGYYSMADCLGL